MPSSETPRRERKKKKKLEKSGPGEWPQGFLPPGVEDRSFVPLTGIWSKEEVISLSLLCVWFGKLSGMLRPGTSLENTWGLAQLVQERLSFGCFPGEKGEQTST